eukprot:UN25926
MYKKQESNLNDITPEKRQPVKRRSIFSDSKNSLKKKRRMEDEDLEQDPPAKRLKPTSIEELEGQLGKLGLKKQNNNNLNNNKKYPTEYSENKNTAMVLFNASQQHRDNIHVGENLQPFIFYSKSKGN